MELIYGADGVAVGWLQERIVYDLDGTALAYVRQEGVYVFGGHYRGQFRSGYFRDRNGDAVAFMKRATGGPIPPTPKPPPIPPAPRIPPLPGFNPLPPMAPAPTYQWSKLSWKQYLEDIEP